MKKRIKIKVERKSQSNREYLLKRIGSGRENKKFMGKNVVEKWARQYAITQ